MVQGIFEAIDHYEGIGWIAKGWAFRPDAPDIPVTLELWWEGGALLRVDADRPRPDLEAAGMGDGRHAFEIRLPDRVTDGMPHIVHVVDAATRTPLASSPRLFLRPRFRGAVDVVDGQTIEGWVEDRDGASCFPVLDVIVDGTVLARIDTARPSRAEDPPGLEGRRHPFRFVMPSALCDGVRHELAVRVSNTGTLLQRCPVVFTISPRAVPARLHALEAQAQALADDGRRLAEAIAREALHEIADEGAYARWLDLHEAAWLPPAAPAGGGPTVSVVADDAPGDGAWLDALARRLASTAAGWELLVPRLPDGCAADPRIVAVGHDGEDRMATALRAARGDAVLLLPRGGLPHPAALERLRGALTGGDADAVYADEDVLDATGLRHAPHFKPDWDPERAMATGYVGFACVLRRTAAVAASDWLADRGLPTTPEAVVEAALLRLPPERVRHRPEVLFHRTRPGTAAAGPGSADRARLVGAVLNGAGTAATAEPQPDGTVRVRWAVPSPPPAVTLVIPTRDRVELLRTCVDSIRDRTAYAAYSILVVDNDSREPAALAYLEEIAADPRVRVHRRPGPFNFSAFNNEAVALVDTPLVGLVNNDIEVITPDWLDEMVSLAARPEVGAVGAKLLFPGGAIQHGGVVVGFFGVADNAQRGFVDGDTGYQWSAVTVQNASAVTAACLVCRTEVYRAVGGLDAENLAVAFNDVDFCLKVRARGLRVLWTPHARLYHHESASRAADRSPEARLREDREARCLAERWDTARIPDPFYSVNLNRTGYSHCAFAWPAQ